jgi:hypothetical protein
MFPMRQSPHFRHPSQLGVSVQDANLVGAQDAMYPAMSALLLCTQHSLQDTKLLRTTGITVKG